MSPSYFLNVYMFLLSSLLDTVADFDEATDRNVNYDFHFCDSFLRKLTCSNINLRHL